MAKTPSKSTLTATEKSVIKTLLNDGWRNQDILALINVGRSASVNFGRISSIKKSSKIVAASKLEVETFRQKKLLFDHVTGLCPIEDERLVRAREAMLLAIELFNTPRIAFKTGAFTMLVNVAWTYLLHQFYENKGVTIVNKDGYSLLLSQMIDRTDSPLSKHCKQNIAAITEIRDVVEHRTIGLFDRKWLPLFQANCLNFEKALTDLFGSRLTLGRDLGFSLQFAKLTTAEIATLEGFDLPEHIAALDASLAAKLEAGDGDNVEYQFKVVYTLTNSPKSKAHFQFVQPESAEGKEIQNVLIKYKAADDMCPLKPSEVIKLVAEKSGRKFTSDKHQKAWKMFKVRPRNNADDPSATDKRYCAYHPPYKSYTYSQDWVEFLVEKVADDTMWQKVGSFNG